MSGNEQQSLYGHYLEARQRIDPELKLIHSVTGLFAKFEVFERDRLEIDPVTLGVVNALLEQSALNVRAALDDFLLVKTAEKGRKQDSR